MSEKEVSEIKAVCSCSAEGKRFGKLSTFTPIAFLKIFETFILFNCLFNTSKVESESRANG